MKKTQEELKIWDVESLSALQKWIREELKGRYQKPERPERGSRREWESRGPVTWKRLLRHYHQKLLFVAFPKDFSYFRILYRRDGGIHEGDRDVVDTVHQTLINMAQQVIYRKNRYAFPKNLNELKPLETIADRNILYVSVLISTTGYHTLYVGMTKERNAFERWGTSGSDHLGEARSVYRGAGHGDMTRLTAFGRAIGGYDIQEARARIFVYVLGTGATVAIERELTQYFLDREDDLGVRVAVGKKRRSIRSSLKEQELDFHGYQEEL